MQQLQLKKELQNTLKDIYDPLEINSLFFRLLEHYTHTTKTHYLAFPEKKLTDEQIQTLQKAIKQLENNVPLQYILGSCEFYGNSYQVTSDVLIPRQETEELVHWIIESTDKNKKIKILDIGCGSGCIVISLAKNLPNACLSAIDISQKTLDITKENAQRNKVSLEFIKADILKLPSFNKKFDIIVSNPPYIREKEKIEIHNNVLQYEPHLALFVSDEEPLLFYDKISDFALQHLSQKGKIYFEINQYLAQQTKELLETKGFRDIVLKKDLNGNSRMIKAQVKNKKSG